MTSKDLPNKNHVSTAVPFKSPSRERENEKETQPPLSSAIALHPFDYLIPTQGLSSFSVPFGISHPYEPVVSLFGEATSLENADALQSEILDVLRAPAEELSYISFKKPAFRLAPSDEVEPVEEPESTLTQFEKQIMELTEEVTKQDYIKPNYKVKRVKLGQTFKETALEKLEKTIISRETNHTRKRDNDDSEAGRKRLKSEGSELTKSEMRNIFDSKKLRHDSKSEFKMLLSELACTESHFKVVYNISGEYTISLFSVNFWTKMKNSLSFLLQTHEEIPDTNIKVLVQLEDEIQRTLAALNSYDWNALFGNNHNRSLKSFQLASILILSSDTLLLVLNSGVKDKHLFKESLFALLFELLHNIQESVLPLFGWQQTTSSNLCVLTTQTSKLIKEQSKLIELIGIFLSKTTVGDSLITHMEYFAFQYIFADATELEKNQLAPDLEELRRCSSDVLLTISRKHPEQSQFIVNEMFANLDNISQLKSKSRKYRLSKGISVQHITILLLRLVQAMDCSDYSFEEEYWRMTGSGSSSRYSQNKVVTEITNKFFNYLSKKIKYSNGICNQIAVAIVTRISMALNANAKKVILGIISDLLDMLAYPEYSASEQILNSIMISMIYICENNLKEKGQSTSLTMAFDIAGMIGSRLISIRKDYAQLFSVNLSVKEFRQMNREYFLEVLKSLKTQNISQDNSFYFFYTQYLFTLKAFCTLIEEEERKITADSLESGNKDAQFKNLIKEVKKVIRSLIQLLNDNPTIFKYNLDHEQDILANYQVILLNQNLIKQYNPFIALITKSLTGIKVKQRSLAIKCLSLLSDKDPTIIQLPAVKKIIDIRLRESYASVCSSILDLLAKVLYSHHELISDFYQMIAPMISNKSVSVRKKAIGICTYLYKNDIDVKVRSTISEKLLKRLDDEDDTVTYEACEALLSVWFISISDRYEEAQENSAISLKTEVLATTGVIVQVFNKGDRNWEYFERFLKEKVLHPNELNEGMEDELRNSLSLMAEFVLEYITEDAIMITNYDDMRQKIGELMRFLAIVVKCDSSSISQDQLLALQPFLTEDLKTGSNLCYYTLQIFRIALPNVTNLNARFINDCETVIMSKLGRFNSKELEEAVASLWTLSKRNSKTKMIASACASTLKLLRVHILSVNSKNSFDQNIISKVRRLIYLIGCFGKECNFEKDKSVFESLGLKEKETVISLLVRHLLPFSKRIEFRRSSVRNIVGICAAHPRIFMNPRILSMLDSTFNKWDDKNLKTAVIEQMDQFLERQDREALERNGLDAKKSDNTTLDIAAFHGRGNQQINDGICTSLVQRYLRQILDFALNKDQQGTLVCINFIRSVTRLGLANPKPILPTVLSLELSPDAHIRYIACHVHEYLSEKYESFIETSYFKALYVAVGYRRSIMSSKEFYVNETFLKQLMKIVRMWGPKGKSVRMVDMITNTLSIIQVDSLLDQHIEKTLFAADYSVFIAKNFNNIVLESQEEVLVAISNISQLLSSQVSDLLGEADDDADETLEGITVDHERQVKIDALLSCLLALVRLRDALITDYSISNDLMMKYQENNKLSDFKTAVSKAEKSSFDISDVNMGKEENFTREERANLLECLREEI